MSSVTGAIRSTVVTLSSNAENTAVTTQSITRIGHGRASTRLADQIAMNWNTPLRRVMATMTIIPVNSPSVLKSTPRIAVSWFSTPRETMRPAPTSATIARLTRSLTMTA